MIYDGITLLYYISPTCTSDILSRFAPASRKESVREAIFGRHCDDFRNRAMHTFARDFVHAYAVRSTVPCLYRANYTIFDILLPFDHIRSNTSRALAFCNL